MMEAKKKYEKPAFRLVTDLGSILECLYEVSGTCLLYTYPSPRDMRRSRMPSSA